jgi:perosamine synthetase
MKNVPLCRPCIDDEAIEAVVSVLRSGWLAHGEYNRKFEEAFAEKLGVAHAISMNSCASALEISLEANGIDGEVIMPSMTMVATANAVAVTGGVPVFCEVDRATRNVTADTIAACITPRTQAVMVVHYAGQPCAMDAIVELCGRHRLLLIEDSAETLGATWNGTQAGAFGLGCFSFFPTKNITTGEGGMFTCGDDDLAARVRALISHGIAKTTLARERKTRPWLRVAEMAGHNYRMPNPLAALGYYQLKNLDGLNAKRQVLAQVYDERLGLMGDAVRTPHVAEGATHVYQMYTIEVEAAARDGILSHLRGNGVGASVHFDPPVHFSPFYRDMGWGEGMLPVTERLSGELITLPIFPDMTADDQDWVVECLGKAVGAEMK